MTPDDRPDARLERRLRAWLHESRSYERQYAARSIEVGLRRSGAVRRPARFGRLARALSFAGALALVIASVWLSPILIGPPVSTPPASRTPLPSAASLAERTVREALLPATELAIAAVTVEDAVWVLTQAGFLHELDPATGVELGVIEVGGNGCGDLAASGSRLWFRVCPPGPALEQTEVVQVLATERRVVGRLTFSAPVGDAPAATPEGLWVVSRPEAGELTFIDASTTRATRTILLDQPLAGVTASGGAVWVTLANGRAIAEVDIEGGRLGRRVELGHSARAALLDGDVLWVGGRNELGAEADGWLWRVDARTGVVNLALELGAAGVDQLAPVNGGVWVLLGADAIRVRGTGDVADRIRVGPHSASAPPQFTGSTRALAVVEDGVWFVPPSGRMRLLSTN